MLYKELSDISDHSDKENSSSDEDSASEYSSTSDEDDSLDLTDFLVEDMCYRYGKCYVDDEEISRCKGMCAKFKKYGVDTKEISECSDYLNGNKPIDLIRNPHCRVPIIVFSLGPAYSYDWIHAQKTSRYLTKVS
jgi:hypothetical protein